MTLGPTEQTCVVHLVWAPAGPQPLARFLDSYRRHDAGVAHRLLILYNGFRGDEDLAPWRTLLAGVEHDELRLARPLLDLAAYREAAQRLDAGRYCFLNSYSVLLADGWLGKLERALSVPGAGLVGATGSWGSVSSFQRFQFGLGGPYARVFTDRRATLATLAAVAARRPSGPQSGRAPIRYARTLLEQSYRFAPYPAPHIRTNAFLLSAKVLAAIAMPRMLSKVDAYRLESGRGSLTAQVARMGLSALVVGRDGHAYPTAEWPASRTLWQGEQENLLIADNQTEDYALGDSAERAVLSRYAWAQQAEPSPAGSDPLAAARRGLE